MCPRQDSNLRHRLRRAFRGALDSVGGSVNGPAFPGNLSVDGVGPRGRRAVVVLPRCCPAKIISAVVQGRATATVFSTRQRGWVPSLVDERVFARISAEVIVEVTDAEAVTSAALTSIGRREYSDDPGGARELQGELDRARQDVVAALLDLVDPDMIVDGNLGVFAIGSTMSVRRCNEDGDPTLELPDFAYLFPVCRCGREDCQSCRGWQFTPRTAAAVWLLALREGDSAYEDILVHGDDPVPDGEWLVFDEYPTDHLAAGCGVAAAGGACV